MKIVHKLKNHEDNINCLHWFPIFDKSALNDENSLLSFKKNFDSPDHSLILCSSSEDKTIRFWCCSKGEQIKCIKAPGAAISTSQRNTSQKSIGNISFTPLCWPTSKYIVSGSFKLVFFAHTTYQFSVSSCLLFNL